MPNRAVVSAAPCRISARCLLFVWPSHVPCSLLTVRYVAGKEEDFKQTSDRSPVTELCFRWSWNKKDDDLWWIISASARNSKLFFFCWRK